MSPEREEELLAIAGDLAKRLESVPVPLLEEVLGKAGQKQRIAAEGISPSCVGNVAAFLASVGNMESFRRFVNLVDQLDSLVEQNQKNPKAEHAVLKRELLRLLSERTELDAREYLYVLTWVQRLLPTRAAYSKEKTRSQNPKKTRPDLPRNQTSGFNQLAAALQKSRGKG